MQFAVPQFTDVEDKLIGPLTLKQFLMLLATGGVVMFFWSIFGINIIFFLFALPVTLLGILVTFAKFNGRPFYYYVAPFVNFFSTPKIMIYAREGGQDIVSTKKLETLKTETAGTAQSAEAAESRLKKLAYLLDQKTGEEKELMEKQQLRPMTNDKQ
jgi:hypothetical protein